MNKRWITLLGRLGTVLIAVGLALVLLSLIPAREVAHSDFSGALTLQSRTFSIESPFYLSHPLDPQRGLYLTAQANHSVAAYLLNVGKEYVYEWITGHFSDSQSPYSALNVSILEEFLDIHPNSVARQESLVDGYVEFQYAPTKVMNVTLIFSNPSTENVDVNYNGKLLNFIIPSERALYPAKFVVPIGLVLSFPWLTSMWRKRKTGLGNSPR